MTLKQFFTGRAVVILILLVIGFLVFAFKPSTKVAENVDAPSVPVTTNVEDTIPPTFTWRYEEADTKNLDENPQTNLYIDARYKDGTILSQLIDTTDGSCNGLDEVDIDTLKGTANTQCYYAGLGYQYKITKGVDGYPVMRKTIEEGSPDYEPPVFEYEKIWEFPFTTQYLR